MKNPERDRASFPASRIQSGRLCDEQRGPHPSSRNGGDLCDCGREIIRGSNTGRRPTRCTICRKVPPPPYEDHDRAKASAVSPDGWLPNPANGHRCRTKIRTSTIQNMRFSHGPA